MSSQCPGLYCVYFQYLKSVGDLTGWGPAGEEESPGSALLIVTAQVHVLTQHLAVALCGNESDVLCKSD